MGRELSFLRALCLLAILGAGVALGAEVREEFYVFSGLRVGWKVILPQDYEASREYPAIIAFSGGSQEMDTVDRLIEHNLRSEAEKRAYLVFIPAANDGQLFFLGGDRIFPFYLDHIRKSYRIAQDRFHVMGASNGGVSALHIALRHPEQFLSVTCFPGFLLMDEFPAYRRLAKLPIRFFVGDQDDLMYTASLLEAALLRLGGLNVTLTILPGAGHGLSELRGPGAARLFDGLP